MFDICCTISYIGHFNFVISDVFWGMIFGSIDSMNISIFMQRHYRIYAVYSWIAGLTRVRSILGWNILFSSTNHSCPCITGRRVRVSPGNCAFPQEIALFPAIIWICAGLNMQVVNILDISINPTTVNLGFWVDERFSWWWLEEHLRK